MNTIYGMYGLSAKSLLTGGTRVVAGLLGSMSKGLWRTEWQNCNEVEEDAPELQTEECSLEGIVDTDTKRGI